MSAQKIIITKNISHKFCIFAPNLSYQHMTKKNVKSETKHILDEVVLAMQDKKAKNIISMNLSRVRNATTQYFVICDAPSTTQVDAIYKNIEDQVRENCGIKPFHKEGYTNSEWILIDYFDIVVHIFLEGTRKFYKLEELWADGVLKQYEDVG